MASGSGAAGSGAGALHVGPGRDIALVGLALWLGGEPVGDPVAWEASPEVHEVGAGSIEVWSAAVTGSGTATNDEVDAATSAARAQFTPEEAGRPAAG